MTTELERLRTIVRDVAETDPIEASGGCPWCLADVHHFDDCAWDHARIAAETEPNMGLLSQYCRMVVVDPSFRWRLDHISFADVTVSALVDVSTALERMTGNAFEITDVADEGDPVIMVVSRESLLAGTYQAPPAVMGELARLAGKPQAYLIHGLAGESIWIVADSHLGARHGLYRLLNLLGARFLLPGESWTRIPSRTDLRLTLHEIREPWLNTVSWAAQFGWGAWGMPEELQQYQGVIWLQWLIRNGAPALQQIGGHNLQAFMSERRSSLQDPLNWAMDANGVRGDPATSEALNYTFHGYGSSGTPSESGDEDPQNYCTQGGLFGVFNPWLDQQIDAHLANPNRDPAMKYTVSVEPGDGQQTCYCPKCVNMRRNGAYGLPSTSPDSTVSDRIAHFANQAQRHLSQKYAAVHASFYAYNQHVLPPSVPIHKDLVVTIATDSFAGGMLPKHLIQAWSDKAKADRFGLGKYGYWSLPSGQGSGAPRLDLQSAVDQVQLCHDKGLAHLFTESTTSLGAVGLHWHLLLRLAWEPDADVVALINEFWERALPDATIRGLVRRAFDRWNSLGKPRSEVSGYTENAYEFGELFNDLAEAGTLAQTADNITKDCVAGVQSYAEFLRLLYLHNTGLQTTQGFEATLEPLFHHVWQTYLTGFTHATAMQSLLGGLGTPAFNERWNPGINGTTWLARNSLTVLSGTALRDQMQAAMVSAAAQSPRLVTSPAIELADEYDLVTVGPISTSSAMENDNFVGGSDKPHDDANYSFVITNEAASQNGDMQLHCYSNTPIASEHLTLTFPDGFVRSIAIDASPAFGSTPVVTTFSCKTLGPGLFHARVECRTDSVSHLWVYPNNVPFVRRGVFYRSIGALGVPHYFWVHSSKESFLCHSEDGSGQNIAPVFALADGTPLVSTQVNGSPVWRIEMPAGHGGVICSVVNVRGPMRLYGVPNIWARSPQQLLVPRELVT